MPFQIHEPFEFCLFQAMRRHLNLIQFAICSCKLDVREYICEMFTIYLFEFSYVNVCFCYDVIPFLLNKKKKMLNFFRQMFCVTPIWIF